MNGGLGGFFGVLLGRGGEDIDGVALGEGAGLDIGCSVVSRGLAGGEEVGSAAFRAASSEDRAGGGGPIAVTLNQHEMLIDRDRSDAADKLGGIRVGRGCFRIVCAEPGAGA